MPANAASIRRAFRCEVVNYYSSWEVPQIAQTCPDNPELLHVNSERVLLRVIRPDGTTASSGELGRVVVTDRGNYVMPLVNYFIREARALTLEEGGYWDPVGEVWQRTRPQVLWRAQSDADNTVLLGRWLPCTRIKGLLKIDLFVEALNSGLFRTSRKKRNLLSA